MWLYKLVAPGRVKRVDVPLPAGELQEGQVRIRMLVAGLCGSDMPRLNGVTGPSVHGNLDEAPLHEVVGEVIESASPLFKSSQHVVGTLGVEASLAEVVTCPASSLIAVPDGVDDVQAVAIQSLSTVLRASGQFPDVRGRTAVVIGVGPCGLCFCHILKERGIAHITAIDPVERSETARAYGADEFLNTTSQDWLASLDGDSRPEVVVEVVGHQNDTIVNAIWAVDVGGFVFGFGAVDVSDYVIPYEQIYLKALTLASGRTVGNWRGVLQDGATYLLKHQDTFASYISHVLPISEAQEGYSLYARPQPGRLKVVLVNSE
jgi:L-iditol 2-dehydrogenase